MPAQCAVYPSALHTNAGASEATEPLFVAAFVPDFTSGPFLAMNHALERINLIGLPGGRQLGVLMCASLDQPAQTFDALVTKLRIPAIVTGFDNNLLYTALDEHRDQTFVLNVSAANKDLVAVGTRGYVINMLGAIESLAPTYPLLVKEAFETIHQRDAADADAGSDAGPSRDLKVSVVYDDTAINNDLGKRVVQLLVAQGLLNSNDALCVRQKNAGANELCKNTADQARAALLQQPRPDVVIVLVSDQNFETIVNGSPSLEEQRRGECGNDGACLPLWIAGPTNALEVARYVRSLDFPPDGGAQVTSARRRFVGVQYAGPEDGTERGSWLQSMKDSLGATVQESLYASAENYYDSLFYLAYGAAAAGVGTEAAEARSFSIGLKTMLPPAPLDDPQRSLRASEVRGSFTTIANQRALSAQTSRAVLFDFFGASGNSSQIDPVNNTWRSVGGVYCIQSTSDEHYPSYDALRYTETLMDGDAFGALVASNAGKFCAGNTPKCGFKTFKKYCNP